MARIEVDDKGRIFINSEQYFSGIDDEMRTFSIGGIKVVTQWLSDRRGRTLTSDDVYTYLNMLNSVSRLTDMPTEIDDFIEDAGGFPFI